MYLRERDSWPWCVGAEKVGCATHHGQWVRKWHTINFMGIVQPSTLSWTSWCERAGLSVESPAEIKWREDVIPGYPSPSHQEIKTLKIPFQII